MPRAQVDLSDPAAGWAAVVRALETSNAWAWLDQVEFAGGERDGSGVWQLRLRPRAASAGVARIATPERLDRLAAQATAVLGTRVRVSLSAAPQPGGGAGGGGGRGAAGMEAGGGGGGAAHAAAGKLGSRVAAEAAEANQQRQEAMGQPLVRAVLSVFPDAVLVRAAKKVPVNPTPSPVKEDDGDAEPDNPADADPGESAERG